MYEKRLPHINIGTTNIPLFVVRYYNDNNDTYTTDDYYYDDEL